MIVQNLAYDDILQVFMQKVMLTQSDVENTFKTPVQYEITPATTGGITPTVTEEAKATAEAKPKAQVNPLHLIIGALIFL